MKRQGSKRHFLKKWQWTRQSSAKKPVKLANFSIFPRHLLQVCRAAIFPLEKKNVVKCATFSLKAAECSARENNSNGCRPFWSSKSFGGKQKRGQFQTLSLLALKLETIWAPSTGAIHSGELFKVDKAVGRRKEVHKRHFQFLVLSLWWTTGNRIWNELEIFFN